MIVFFVLSSAYILWLFAGKTFCSLVDSVFVRSKYMYRPVIQLSPGGLTIDAITGALFIDRNNENTFLLDSSNRVTFIVGGNSFSMGKTSEMSKGEFDWQAYLIKPDTFDSLSLKESHSLFFWKEPLKMNFMTGFTPDRYRFRYYTLHWQKPSGAALTINWQFIQYFNVGTGWSEANNSDDLNYGITSLEIILPTN